MEDAQPPKRRRRRLMLVALLCLVLYLAVEAMAPRPRPAAAETPRSWLEPPFAAAVTMVTHADDRSRWPRDHLPGRVRCWSREGWRARQAEWARRSPQLGPLTMWRAYTTAVPRWEVELAPNVCGELQLLERDRTPVWRSRSRSVFAYSVGMLAHEAQHFAGVLDERSAECYGMQWIAPVAVALGRTPKEGRYLASLYLRRVYPREPASYRTSDCRNGTALDLHPKRALWP